MTTSDRELLPAAIVTIAGQEYPVKTVSNCWVCQSPRRSYIEEQIIAGMGYKTIAEGLTADLDADDEQGHLPPPTVRSLQNHVKRNHMPIVATTERMLIEQRAKDLGRDIEGHLGSLVDYTTVNQIVIQRGMARIAKGEIEPTVAETLAAIRQQHTIEQSVGEGLDVETMQDALYCYMEIAREFIPPDLMSQYGQALKKHPVLRAIMNKQATDAEVISEEE